MIGSPASPTRNHSLDRLFPNEDVAVVDVRYSADHPAPRLARDLAPLVSNAVKERRREFSYGRACSRLALDAMGLGGSAVGRGADRAPIWPAGATGSISHTAGYAVAVAARHRGGHGVGIDAERPGAVGVDIVPHVLGHVDRALLSVTNESRRDELTTVVFAAKEALFKAQYPLTRRWVGFDEVQVASIITDTPEVGGTLSIVPAHQCVIRNTLRWPITAHWLRVADVVVVGLSAARDGPGDGSEM